MNKTYRGGEDIAGHPSGCFPHRPVLYHEVLNALKPMPEGYYLDGTIGAGGHAEGLLKSSSPNGKLLGLDLDPKALAIAAKRLDTYGDRALLRQGSYLIAPDVLDELKWPLVHGTLLDLGVSSMQIDQPER